MNLRPLSFVLLLVLLAALAAPVPAFAQRKKTEKNPAPAAEVVELPKLISTTGGGPKWRTLKELEQFAAKGDPQACMELGDRLLEGDGFPKDPARARPFFEQAAAAGVPDAFFRLGKIHHDGLGVRADRAKGYEYYLEAAKRGVPEAQYNVGAQLASGRGVRRDFVEGLAWLIVAGKSGATGDGEKLLRERMARRPADITAAEKRAQELLQALAAGAEIQTRPPASTPSRASPPSHANPLPAPPKVERPTFQPDKVDPPKVTVPLEPITPPTIPKP